MASAGLEVRKDDDFAKMQLLAVLAVLELLSSVKNARRKGAALSNSTTGVSSSTIPAQDHAGAELLSPADSASKKEHVTLSSVAFARKVLRSVR